MPSGEVDEKRIYDSLSLFVQHFHDISDTLTDEEDVKSSVIERFLDIMGWNVHYHMEVKKEQKVEGRKRADYALKVDGEVKIFIEAKRVDTDLWKGGDGKRTYVEQAILYALYSGKHWALLTNGKRWILFNASWDVPLKEKVAFDIQIDEFLKNFDKIKLLARNHVASGKLDEYFEGRPMVPPVDERVVKFLLACRSELTKSVLKHNKGRYDLDTLREGIQRILDRFLFFKICEDRDILEFGELKDTLEYLYKATSTSDEFIQGLIFHYRKFEKRYDGEMFDKHPCEDFIIDKSVFKKIILGLYEYEFAEIDADILGKIYENYLGNTLQELERGLQWVADQTERKKFGQYYTPQYVVDYIVENTLGKVLEEKKTLEDLKKIKVLDPACGSGAFLIKAYEYIKRTAEERIERLKKRQKNNLSDKAYIDWEQNELPKIREEYVDNIPQNNIYGVDLNPEAVELTKVNLWLRSIRKGVHLNNLEHNIECGNSLISGTEEELREYFGDEWGEKRPFNWEDEFGMVFDGDKPEGEKGPDVTIGNPPYINVYNMSKEDRDYYKTCGKYISPHLKYDIFVLFIEKGLRLLRNGGRLSFIIPYSLLTVPYAEILRKFILENCIIEKIMDLSDVRVFQDATVRSVIIILKKEVDETSRNNSNIEIIRQKDYERGIDPYENEISIVEQSVFTNTPKRMFRIELTNEKLDLIKKIKNKSIQIGDVYYVSKGIVAYSKSDDRKKEDFLDNRELSSRHFKYLEGGDVPDRYEIDFRGLYLAYDPTVMSRPTFIELQKSKKILIRAIAKGLISAYDGAGNYFVDQKLIICSARDYIEKYVPPSKLPKQEKYGDSSQIDDYYTLAILNSKLLRFYYHTYLFGGLSIHPEDVRNLPLYPAAVIEQKPFIELVDKMLELSKQLRSVNADLDKYLSLRPRITDASLSYYYNDLDVNDREVLNNANQINKASVKKPSAVEDGEWLTIKVNYTIGKKEARKTYDDFEVLKIKIPDEWLRKFIYYSINNHNKNLGAGGVLSKVLSTPIPHFSSNSTENQQTIEELMQEYLQAVNEREALEREIEETDREIDKLVYELYNLTPEEVAIVEDCSVEEVRGRYGWG